MASATNGVPEDLVRELQRIETEKRFLVSKMNELEVEKKEHKYAVRLRTEALKKSVRRSCGFKSGFRRARERGAVPQMLSYGRWCLGPPHG